MTISPADYLAACKRRFGDANPQHMREPVWEWMVRRGDKPYAARRDLGLPPDYGSCEGGACGLPRNPDWCFMRMGMAKLALPDGRTLYIAGEHEDSYDPHFCIYNDVIVRRGTGNADEVSIFGYPREVFPPTDFHTATLIGDAIWIVGSLGYFDKRGTSAQILVLDSNTYQVRSVSPAGISPGWLHDHRAKLLDDGATIEVWKGEVVRREGDREVWRKVTDVFRLDTQALSWSKVTDTSAWRQYRIKFDKDIRECSSGRDQGWYTGEILLELGYKVDAAPSPTCLDDSSSDDEAAESRDRIHTVWVGDIPVRIEDTYWELQILFEGDLPESDRRELLDGLCTLMCSTNRRVIGIVEC